MSVHRLIVGQSMSGKTNLAKHIAGGFSGDVLVFDPVKSCGWPTDAMKFSDPEKFLKHAIKATTCAVFIDEAKLLWDYDTRRADRLLYQKRHDGLLVHLIAQRAKMIRPNARDQCATLYAFKQSREDVDILKGNFGEALEAANTLKKGEFIVSDGFSAQRFALDYSKYVKCDPLKQPVPKLPPK